MELWWLLHGAGTVAVAGEQRDSPRFGVLQGRQVFKWPNGDMLCDTALSCVWCGVGFLFVVCLYVGWCWGPRGEHHGHRSLGDIVLAVSQPLLGLLGEIPAAGTRSTQTLAPF